MILNGRTSGDFWGCFTHYNKNKGASTVDIAVGSSSIFEYVNSFRVMPQLEISDHCKIILNIDNINHKDSEIKKEYNWYDLPVRYQINDTGLKSFAKAFNSDIVSKYTTECEQFLEAGLIESSGRNYKLFSNLLLR